MKSYANNLLKKLLEDSEKLNAGVRKSAASITSRYLKKYHECKSTYEKEDFEAVIDLFVVEGAIKIHRSVRGVSEGFIDRMEAVDTTTLARLLNVKPYSSVFMEAKNTLLPFTKDFPVLTDLISTWQSMGKVRSSGAEDYQKWIDAIKVITYVKDYNIYGNVLIPINEVSGKLFKDTKKIKTLSRFIDVLLTQDINSGARPASEVWSEIGLFREEHPIRLSGNVEIERSRVTAYLDTPYVGLPAETILAVKSKPKIILTIENQTTFHAEASLKCNEDVLIIYTGGMPNSPWLEMYVRILKSCSSNTLIYHWGDIDEGGFRISSFLAKAASSVGKKLLPYNMDPNDIPAQYRKEASQKTVNQMIYFAKKTGWDHIAKAVSISRITAEQEVLHSSNN